MNKTFILLTFLVSFGTIRAQTQQGYVKTLGRPNQQGRALSDVSIRVKGGHNAVLSGQDGTFAMPMPGKKLGDAYSLQQVHKSGYDLKDKDAVGRQYAYSNKVPLTLVMFSRSDYQQEKQRIENEIYNTVEKRYKAEFARLKQQENTHRITAEQARQQLHQLQDGLEKIQGLVDGLAEHYAQVDYDELNDKEREINLAIEAGELERADSLLQLLGIQQRAQDIAQRLQAGEQLKKEAQQEMAEVLKRQEKDAEYLYQLYTIALAKFDNDRARFYIETRAALDTMNIEWQNSAIDYLTEFTTDFSAAMQYAQRALYLNKQRNGNSNVNVARSHIKIGTILYYQGQLDEAVEYYREAYKMLENQQPSEDIVEMQLCLGAIYSSLERQSWNSNGGTYAQACRELMRECYQQAFDISQQLPTISHTRKGGCYYGLAIVSLTESMLLLPGNVEKNELLHKSKAFFEQAINEWKLDPTVNASKLASCYMMMSGIPQQLQDFQSAIEQLTKAKDLLIRTYGNEHPNVATCLSSLGSTYADMHNWPMSAQCYQQAYEIRLRIFGEHHSDTKEVHYLMAKAQEIIRTQLPEQLVPDVILVNYLKDHDYKKATEAFKSSEEILRQVNNGNLLMPIRLYECWGTLNVKAGDYSTAIDNYYMMLQLREASDEYAPKPKHYKMFLDVCKQAEDWQNYLLCFYHFIEVGNITDEETLTTIKRHTEDYLRDHPNDTEVKEAYQEFLKNRKEQ